MPSRLLLILIISAIPTACTSGSEQGRGAGSTTAPAAEGLSSDDLLAALKAHQMNPINSGESTLLNDAPGMVYQLTFQRDKEKLYIHQYPSGTAARQKSKEIAPKANNETIEWIDTPHFFLCDSMIVIYLGNNAVMKTTLAEKCGPQFSGMS